MVVVKELWYNLAPHSWHFSAQLAFIPEEKCEIEFTFFNAC